MYGRFPAALREILKNFKPLAGRLLADGCWHSNGIRFLAAALAICCGSATHAQAQNRWKFDFGTSTAAPEYIAVTPDTVYSAEKKYGFEPATPIQALEHSGGDALRSDGVTGEGLFKFSVAVPEGNYRVTVVLGDAEQPTVTTVKAEARRLMLESVRTAPGQFVRKSFIVSIRSPKISTGGEVALNT